MTARIVPGETWIAEDGDEFLVDGDGVTAFTANYDNSTVSLSDPDKIRALRDALTDWLESR
jgi:hypothetical protein